MICDSETPRARAGDRADPRRGARRHPRRGEAGADAVGARGGDGAVRERHRGRRAAHRAAAHRDRRGRATSASLIGAAGTHPAALYEEQAIVDRPRYHELVGELGWIAQRELIFGTHIHIGIDDAEKAIYVADGMRGYLPLLLGMSSNSPMWRGMQTRMMSSRTPVFRAFPRVGIPPYYGSWEIYSHRVEQMMRGGRDRRLHLPLVGRPPAPEPRHRRAARLRPADPRRAHDRVRGAGAVARPPARRPLRRRGAERRAPLGADRRQQGPGRPGRDRGQADRLRARGGGRRRRDGPGSDRRPARARPGARLRGRARRASRT